jgi:hypothetical protein
MKIIRVPRVVLVAMLALCPSVGLAQTSGSIAGGVKDTTGAVLPGVTVEVASPALIEKVRTAVTDGSGAYKITDLRPGTYSVTFTLPGFATVKREGINLTAGFTASINAELKVGSVAETVVVSGQSPLVDVQNIREQRVLTREVLDTVPTAKTMYNLAALAPGMNVIQTSSGAAQDVGGTGGDNFQGLTIHGSRRNDQQSMIDGMSVAFFSSFAGSLTPASLGDGTIDQTVIEVSGHAAEIESGGVLANIIPKQGGNEYHGNFFGNFANQNTQANNYTPALKAQGLLAPLPIKRLSDVNPTFGGPIKKDTLWFFAAYRDKESQNFADPTTKGYNLNPNGWTFVPDLSRQPVLNQSTKDVATRVTWQMTDKQRLATFFEYNDKYEPLAGGSTEQNTYIQRYTSYITQVTWSAPLTNRLLLDAGLSLTNIPKNVVPQTDAVPVAATELSTGLSFRSPRFSSALSPQSVLQQKDHNHWYRGSVSYVTGAHAFKAGFAQQDGLLQNNASDLANYEIALLRGVPSTVTYYPTPYVATDYFAKSAAYGQDQWHLGRMTVNAGLRFDWFRTRYPDYQVTATQFLPARTFPAANVLNWKDLSPRLGWSYDLFGDGKTAIKASASRYVLQEAVDLTRAVDPTTTSGVPLTRTLTVPGWDPTNVSTFLPIGDPLNPAANGELGPSPNANFGKAVQTTTYAPSFANGFDVRPYEWEFTAGLQHELLPQVSANVAFFRRIYGNFTVTDNTAAAASDFNPFCITAPSDARLPGGGGKPICGLFDLNPSKFGQLQNLVTTAATYGKVTDHWQGLDFTVNARVAKTVVQGGVSTGKETSDNCAVFSQVPENGALGLGGTAVAGPLAGPYCHEATPWLTQVKLQGSYMFPWSIQAAAVFQSIPGQQILATYVATNAQIAPSLGRNLSAGANATASINLIAPGTDFGPRVNQIDARFSRNFKVRMISIKAMADLYNLLNNNVVLLWNNTYGTNGSSWLVPSQILGGRMLKLGVQVDF